MYVKEPCLAYAVSQSDRALNNFQTVVLNARYPDARVLFQKVWGSDFFISEREINWISGRERKMLVLGNSNSVIFAFSFYLRFFPVEKQIRFGVAMSLCVLLYIVLFC